jgi:hypothetical protein
LFSVESDGTRKVLSLDGVTNIQNVPNRRNLGSRGLTLANGTSTDQISDETMRDESILGLENDGFKPLSAEISAGDGFAYNEPFQYQKERTIDATLLKIASDEYSLGDMVNSGYAKTLRLIAHRDNIINHCYNGNPINNMNIPLYPIKESDGMSEMDVLISRMSEIREWAKGTGQGQLGDTQYGDKWSQIYYPAASACYAYEPLVEYGEQLHNRFKKHNWFLPASGLLSRIVWYLMKQDGSNQIKEDSPFYPAILKGFFTQQLIPSYSSSGYGEGTAWLCYIASRQLQGASNYAAFGIRPVCSF